MTLNAIERLLQQRIGLSVDTMGSETVMSVIRRRMAECQIQDTLGYVRYLDNHEDEWEELIEALVVPETWFLRNEESFAFLGRYLTNEWIKKRPGGHIRALSIPCSTGEEPYSIAMTFLEAGLTPPHITIDAVDISRKALAKAEVGVYGPESFRRQDVVTFRERYFETRADGSFHIEAILRNLVRYRHGNILDANILQGTAPYDIVFCRNLLIYLSQTAREQVSATIDRLLAKTGILFVGHAERPLFQAANFVAITIPGVFAYYRAGQLDECHICGQHRPVPRFERRKSTRIPPSTSSGTAKTSPPAVPTPMSRATPKLRQKATPSPKSASTMIDRRKPRDAALQSLDMARELADQGNLQEALRLCNRVLHENAGHVQAHFLMGLIYQALNDEHQAENSFNKTIYLDPNHEEALYYLALIMEDRGQHTKAKQYRQRIHRIYQRTQKN